MAAHVSAVGLPASRGLQLQPFAESQNCSKGQKDASEEIQSHEQPRTKLSACVPFLLAAPRH